MREVAYRLMYPPARAGSIYLADIQNVENKGDI
jgi:hypothetical protein